MAQHAPLVALDCALLGTICVNHQPRSPSFQFARATDHENDQMVRIRTRRELVDMGRVLVRPEQQRTPTRFQLQDVIFPGKYLCAFRLAMEMVMGQRF